MNINEIISTNWQYFVIFGVVIIGSIVYAIVMSKNMKKNASKYLSDHPDAVKIYLTEKAVAVTEPVRVHMVNGEKAILFNLSGKTGLYVAPGDAEINMSYTYSRPGVMHKTVTKTYGPLTKEVTVEAGKEYKLSFDKKAKEFVFAER